MIPADKQNLLKKTLFLLSFEFRKRYIIWDGKVGKHLYRMLVLIIYKFSVHYHPLQVANELHKKTAIWQEEQDPNLTRSVSYVLGI